MLALQSLRYLVRPRPWPLEQPLVLQFPVNDICDSKCRMCNIWQRKRDEEISPGEARRVFSDPLFRRVTAAGMNGGEPTLRRDLPELADAMFDGMPKLRSISLITNGLHAERAIASIDALAGRIAARHGRLDVMVSLDGLGALHDRVRGAAGNFEQAVRVLDHVLARKDAMDARVGCTIIRDNAYGLHELLDFCISRGVYVKFRLGVPHRRLYNLEQPGPKTIGKRSWLDTQPFALDDAQRWHVGQFLLGLVREFEPAPQQQLFYRSLAAQLLHGAPRRAGCDWQHRGVTLSSRGELMYCAVQSESLGDARDTSAKALYYGRKEVLDRILAEKCAGCAHDYVGPPGGKDQARVLVEELLRRVGFPRRRLRGTPLQAAAMHVQRWREARSFAAERLRLRLEGAKAAVSGLARSPHVLICGWYGTETLGDKAILAAIVEAIRREAPHAPIRIASLEPRLTRLTLAELPQVQGCSVVDLDRALADVASAGALIFGGGPLMAVAPVAAMEALFLRARAARVPAIVAGCGVGPLGSGEFRSSIAALLSNASARIFRDQESRLACAKLGVASEEDQVTEDPAVSWVLAAGASAVRLPGRAPVLALGLRDWPYLQYAPQLGLLRAERIRAAFERTLVEALDGLVRNLAGLRLLAIPFCTHDQGGDDRLLYWRLARATPALHEAFDASSIGRDLGPNEYLKRLVQADACLAMRFHSMVFSVALSKPVVAIDYTLGNGKSAALGRRHGLDAMALDEVRAEPLLQRLRAALQPSAARPQPGQPLFPAAFHAAWRRHVTAFPGS